MHLETINFAGQVFLFLALLLITVILYTVLTESDKLNPKLPVLAICSSGVVAMLSVFLIAARPNALLDSEVFSEVGQHILMYSSLVIVQVLNIALMSFAVGVKAAEEVGTSPKFNFCFGMLFALVGSLMLRDRIADFSPYYIIVLGLMAAPAGTYIGIMVMDALSSIHKKYSS